MAEKYNIPLLKEALRNLAAARELIENDQAKYGALEELEGKIQDMLEDAGAA